MPQDYQIHGANDKALFNLTVHRGEGMVLLAMDWKKGKPPLSFAGFAIEYKEPGGTVFFTVRNRICFPGSHKEPDALRLTDAALTDSEVPLGSLSAECAENWALHVPCHTGIHERA